MSAAFLHKRQSMIFNIITDIWGPENIEFTASDCLPGCFKMSENYRDNTVKK